MTYLQTMTMTMLVVTLDMLPSTFQDLNTAPSIPIPKHQHQVFRAHVCPCARILINCIVASKSAPASSKGLVNSIVSSFQHVYNNSKILFQPPLRYCILHHGRSIQSMTPIFNYPSSCRQVQKKHHYHVSGLDLAVFCLLWPVTLASQCRLLHVQCLLD